MLFCKKRPLTAYRVTQLKPLVFKRRVDRILANIRYGDKLYVILKHHNGPWYIASFYYSHQDSCNVYAISFFNCTGNLKFYNSIGNEAFIIGVSNYRNCLEYMKEYKIKTVNEYIDILNQRKYSG